MRRKRVQRKKGNKGPIGPAMLRYHDQRNRSFYTTRKYLVDLVTEVGMEILRTNEKGERVKENSPAEQKRYKQYREM